MTRPEAPDLAQSRMNGGNPVIFELFIRNRFSELELASVVSTLQAANRVRNASLFDWKIISDNPGMVRGACGTLARAEPAVPDHELADFLIVVGGERCKPEAWLQRVRAMQRISRPVVILSNAATGFIKATKVTDKPVTTHWADVTVLSESGYYPTLSTRLSESAGGVVTAAGGGYTTELTISLISEYLTRDEIAELGSQLIVETIRDKAAEQPKGVSFLTNMFDPQTEHSIRIMEENIAEPLSTREISRRLGISIRQLERLFSISLNKSPGRYYRQLRTRTAHSMITGTKMEFVEIALATGFNSVSALSNAYRKEYGVSPSRARAARAFSPHNRLP